MGKLQDFLMQSKIENETREVMVRGFPEPFVIKSITQKENKAIRRAATRTIIDPKTRQRQDITDADLYNTKLVIACCIEPNFKDAELQAHAGVMGAEELIETVMKPGQFTDLLIAVQKINGFDEDINDQRDEAKN